MLCLGGGGRLATINRTTTLRYFSFSRPNNRGLLWLEKNQPIRETTKSLGKDAPQNAKSRSIIWKHLRFPSEDDRNPLQPQSRLEYVERKLDTLAERTGPKPGKDAIEAKTVRTALRQIASKRLATINLQELRRHPVPIARSRTQFICSYNCDAIDKLYIPGEPPLWAPPILPAFTNVAKMLFRNPNSSIIHLWRSFEAIQIMQPDFNFSDVDVVCSVGTLSALYQHWHYVRPSNRIHGLWAHFVQDTLILDIVESPSTKIQGLSHWEKDHQLQRAVTVSASDIPSSAPHYQWWQYRLGDLRFAVYSKVDAWSPVFSTSSKQIKEKVEPKPSLKAPSARPGLVNPNTLVFETGRTDIPKTQLMHILFMGTKGTSPTAHYAPIYLSLINNYIKVKFELNDGQHRITRIDKRMTRFERARAEHTFPKVIALLHEIRLLTKKSSEQRTFGVSDGGVFTMYEPKTRAELEREGYVRSNDIPDDQSLPEGIVKQFWRGGSNVTAKEEKQDRMQTWPTELQSPPMISQRDQGFRYIKSIPG